MQPPTYAASPANYLPDITFWAKMQHADAFVIADDLQYSNHAQFNRCRIKGIDGAQWLTVPVRTIGVGSQKINEVRIVNETDWRQRHLRSLHVCYRNAAYFEKYIDFFEELYRREWRFLIDLNLAGIEFCQNALGITTPVSRSSELQIAATGTARLIAMGERLQAKRYLCERHYQPAIEVRQFGQAGLAVQFFEPAPKPYYQLFGDFEPGLSVLDLLFNEGDAARDFLPDIPKS